MDGVVRFAAGPCDLHILQAPCRIHGQSKRGSKSLDLEERMEDETEERMGAYFVHGIVGDLSVVRAARQLSQPGQIGRQQLLLPVNLQQHRAKGEEWLVKEEGTLDQRRAIL